MSVFLCPVCGCSLEREDRRLFCENGHSYDLARQGYVNLLQSNQPASKRHGDDRRMVQARRAFLDQGYYQPLLDGVLQLAVSRAPRGGLILDAGCGEGWYTAGVAAAVRESGCGVCGVDISRDAVKAAAGRHCGAELAVASAARLPLADGGCDGVLNLFSPLEAGEYGRVLKPGGWLLRAIPLEKHLWELKAAVYDAPYENDVPDPKLEGFQLTQTLDVTGAFTLSRNEDILSLFEMTPYYYKTGAKDQAKLAALETLTTQLQVRLLLYTKQ